MTERLEHLLVIEMEDDGRARIAVICAGESHEIDFPDIESAMAAAARLLYGWADALAPARARAIKGARL